MLKMFDVVGVSRARADLPLKLRVANGNPDVRRKNLERAGDVDITLFQVAAPLTKEQALDWLKENYPELVAQMKEPKGKGKATGSIKEDQPEAIVESETSSELEAPSEPETINAEAEVEVEVTDAALSPAAKAALRRVRDAARKREKRAAAKAVAEFNEAVSYDTEAA